MKTVAVKKQMHLAELDRLINLVSQSENSRLRLPNRLRERGALGLEGHIIQLILTWIRHHPDGAIFHTYVPDSAKQRGFENLCQRMFGLCALALSDEIQLTSGIRISRGQALLSAMPRVEAMRQAKFEKAFKGAYVGLPFIRSEHGGKELGEPFYNQNELVGNRKFLQIMKSAVSAVLRAPRDQQQISEQILPQITEIVRELFTNTHKHARHDEGGNLLLKNFRCVTFNVADVSHNSISYWLKAGGTAKVKQAEGPKATSSAKRKCR